MELPEPATDLEGIRMQDQRSAFFARPYSVTEDFWIWVKELKEAKALGRMIIAESISNASQESRLKKTTEMLEKHNERVSALRIKLTRLLEQTNINEGKKTALCQELEEQREKVNNQTEWLAKLERQLHQMMDKFREAIAVEGDLRKEQMLVAAQKALEDSTLFKHKWREEQASGEAVCISKGEEYRQKLEQ